MSIPLPAVNLAAVNVGQSGTVNFGNVGVGAGGVSGNPAHTKDAGTILIYNESGTGLLITFQTSQSGFYLPAGGWQPVPILAGEVGYTWTAVYTLPSPPVTLLLTTYYFPGEKIPPQPTLGNSPIGIGGSVQVSSVQTLSYENGAGLVIDIGETTHQQLVTINADGTCNWFVLQAGVAVLAFSTNTTPGSPISLNNPQLFGGPLQLLKGSVSRMFVDGPFTIRQAGTTVNHSLGAVPDFVWCISDTGGIGTASFYSVNFGSLSSTQATIYCSNDNGGSGTRTWIMTFKA